MVMPFFPAMEGVSQHLGVLEAGETVRVLQVVADSKGKVKMQHEKGWTPLRAPNGAEVFEDLGGGAQMEPQHAPVGTRVAGPVPSEAVPPERSGAAAALHTKPESQLHAGIGLRIAGKRAAEPS